MLGKTRIAKNGDTILGKTLWIPALCVWKHSSVINDFYEHLKDNGKNGKAIAVPPYASLFTSLLLTLNLHKSNHPVSLRKKVEMSGSK
jgi:hypothetical protein